MLAHNVVGFACKIRDMVIASASRASERPQHR